MATSSEIAQAKGLMSANIIQPIINSATKARAATPSATLLPPENSFVQPLTGLEDACLELGDLAIDARRVLS